MTDLSKRIAELSPELRELLLQRLQQRETSDTPKKMDHSPGPTVLARPEERYQPFPLTDIQQAYWIGRGDAFELGGVACHIYREFTSQKLDVDRLQRALQQLIARHEMLRAVIHPDGRQQILPELPPYKIAVTDLRGQSPEEVSAQLDAIRSQMSHQVLSSECAPLFEFRAALLNDQQTRLHVSLDVLVSDARSLDIFFGELQQLYMDADVALPPLELSFRDYVLATAGQTGTEAYRRAKDYWLKRLSSLPPAPELPLAKNPGSIKKVRFGRRSARLDAESWSLLKQRAAKAGVTPSVVLLAAYSEVLSLWSKNPRFTINLTLFNRLPVHPHVNEVIGDFTSVTLLEVDSGSAPTFQGRARNLQQQLWTDMDHRSFGGVQVLRERAKQQGEGQVGYMPVVFTSLLPDDPQNAPSPLAWLGKMEYELTQTPQLWLDHMAGEEDGALVTKWEAVEELFPAGLLDDMFAAYGRLLQSLATEEESWQEERIDGRSKLVPPTQLEQRALINATDAPLTDDLLHTLFFTQAQERPDQLAVVTPKLQLSYQELSRRANQVGNWLRQHHARPNMLVGVVMEKGWEQIVGILGVLASGAAYLPIDATLPPERLTYVLEHGQVSLVLTQSWHDTKIDWPSGIQRFCVDQADQMELDERPLEAVQRPTDLAYVIYTSGSTGLPKGVVIDHRGAVNTVLDVNQRFQVKPEDSVLALSALNFDLSVYDVFGLLAAGGTVVVPTAFSERNPAHWAELMTQHGITLWNTVPALMHMLVEYLAGRSETLPDSLRLVMMSGDWIPLDLPDRIRQMTKSCSVVSLGGATEASIWSILYPIEDVDPAWPSIPYGRPMVNQSFHVFNDAFVPCPVWTPGSLYIGGIGLAKGYWRDEEKTRNSFISHPLTGECLYRTGDLGRYLPDGNIEFLGREDFQVKIRGHRVELGEIESTLLSHSAVQSVVVTAAGETRGNKRLIAYVVPASDTAAGLSNGHAPANAGHDLQKPVAMLVDPLERLKFKLRQPGLRVDRDRPAVQLQASPDEILLPEYLLRRSSRQYGQERLALEQFSDFLSVLKMVRVDGSPFPKYRYASAGSLYPVQTYLYIKPDRIEGVAGGTYYYDPAGHRLVSLSSHAELNRERFPHSEAIFDGAAFAIFQVAQLAAIAPLYGEHSRDFCLLEAGLICQLLETAAPAHQIGLCQIGGLDFSPIQQHFLLSDSHAYLHCLLGGPLDATVTSREALAKDLDLIRPLLELVKSEPATTGDTDNEHLASTIHRAGGGNRSGSSPRLAEELKEYLAEKLPEYMVPASFVFLEALPLSANGKVDRKALPEPELIDHEVAADHRQPRTDAERILKEIWCEVLGIDSLGMNENFFELGGDSIMAIQIIAKSNQAGLQLTPLQIFEHQTVAGLAAAVSPSGPEDRADTGLSQQPPESRNEAATHDNDFNWSQEDFSSIADALRKLGDK